MFNVKKCYLVVFTINFFFLLISSMPLRAKTTFDVNKHYAHLHQKYTYIDEKLLYASLKAYAHAVDKKLVKKSIVTMVDYSKPSDEKRLWVFDFESDTLLFKDYVAHGQGSGDRFATRFSNRSGSHQSSYGVFVTENPYMGSHGYSLRLNGLEKGVNDKAKSRAIVMHSAWYVSKKFADRYGRVGRSYGCFAVSKEIIKSLVNQIKSGSLIVAFYPDKFWLNHSDFVS